MKFGLSREHFEVLNDLAVRPLKGGGAQVWIFGSRGRGDYKKYSDIDLLFLFPTSPPAGWVGRIEEALEESLLPYKVDLVDLNQLASSYRVGVMQERIQLD